MNQTLYQLAYRNIKKHKKHYTFMIIFIFFITIFFHCFTIVQESSYLATKQYNEEHYGMWFMSVGFTQDTQESIINTVKNNSNHIRYGRMNHQDVLEDDIKVGYISDELHDLCHIPLIQGHRPQKDNEIMIDQRYLQEKHYKLNQEIELPLKEDTKLYRIVGIVNKSQDIFPDIYTNYEEIGDSYFIFDQNIEVIYTEDNIDYMFIDGRYTKIDDYNEYGYNHNPQMEKYALIINNSLILAESIIICMAILYAMTSTSLKKRTKEFALLRGIGMTTKQLILMLFYENIIMSFITILIATFLSPLMSYGIIFFLTFQKGVFIFQYHILNIVINVIIILLGVIIAVLYPVFQSAKTALSGSFDSQSFQYIQIRYRKLKKQNAWNLALREMKVYKKMTIFLLVVFGLCTYMIITLSMSKLPHYPVSKTFQTKYINWEVETLENGYQVIVDKLSDAHLGKQYQLFLNRHDVDIKYHNKNYVPSGEVVINGDIVRLDDISLFDDCSIYGRFPQNKNEAFVIPPLSLIESQTYIENDEVISSEKDLEKITIGTQLNLGNNLVEVVGVCKPLESLSLDTSYTEYLYKFPSGLYILPELYKETVDQKQDIIHYLEFYETEEELNEIKKKLEDCGVQSYFVSNEVKYSLEIEQIDITKSIQNIPLSTVIFGICISIIICYGLNKNETMNNINDYALYRLIGMTKKDMLKKQLCKALIMTLCIAGFELFWICIYSMFFGTFVIPVVEIFMSMIGTIVVSIIVYCLPLLSILKNNAIDMMNKSE